MTERAGQEDMTKIKLCGLFSEEDIRCVNQLRPDYIGFVFWQKSKRYVTMEQAKKLKELLAPHIQAVGVFVDEEAEEIIRLVQTGIIDVIQLHGNEDDAYLQALREQVNCKIIQAYKIRSTEDVKRANASKADLILLDSGMGTGQTFDWTYVKEVDRPFLLAGGLTPENVQEAVTQIHPYGVDASSSLETDGKKDPEKLKAFMHHVRTVDDNHTGNTV